MLPRRSLGADIAARLLALAITSIEVAERTPLPESLRHLRAQLGRSVTSAGANYEEARHAESRADFVHKTSVAAKELAEGLYWLRLIDRLQPTAASAAVIHEADQLVAILVASARTARSRK